MIEPGRCHGKPEKGVRRPHATGDAGSGQHLREDRKKCKRLDFVCW